MSAVDTSTLALVDRVLDGDRAVTQEMRLKIHGILKGEDVQKSEPKKLEPCYTREEVAHLLKCSVKNVDYHRARGRLVPIRIPNSTRIRGYSAASVRAMLSGTKEAAA